MEQTETMLNFQKILQQVTQFLSFEMSLDYISTYLKVETTYKTVKALQRYTQAFYEEQVQGSMSSTDLLPLHSFKTILQKLATETVLTPKECLQIANLYDNIQKTKRFYDKQAEQGSKENQLEKLLDLFTFNEPILNEIRRVITKDAMIADAASPRLKALRRAQTQTEGSIRQALQQLMQSEKTKLAENLYTLRNNRYVLPIKAEFKNTFTGILHDQSASGTTVYIEPQRLVNINNKLQQLTVEEAQEIELILRELSEKLFMLKDEIANNTKALARFDIYRAKAIYAYKYDMSSVEIVDVQEIQLYNAKHPLLQNVEAVGNDIFLGGAYHTSVLMITGANTGGKSIFLKTIGLLSLMAQTGLFLPVARNKDNQLGVFTQIFIVVGDEQSLENNLSTFSAHITTMKRILAKSDEKTLVLLDELGSGTDPTQGAALAIAMLEDLAAKETLIVATTHFNEVKAFIMQAPYAENASMTFDVATLQPTYKIRYGSYGSSYAFDIAQALKLPQSIIDNARAHAAGFADETSELLTVYEQRLQALDMQNELLNEKTANLAQQTAVLEAKQVAADKEIERERKAVISTAEKQLAKKLKQVETFLEAAKQKQDLKQNEYADLKGQLNTIATSDVINPKNKRKDTIPPKTLRANDIIYIEHLQTKGILLKKQGEKWLVKVGELSIILPEHELVFLKKGSIKKEHAKQVRKRIHTVSDTLDLRGFRVLEGITELEMYLANAESAHKVVKIIHGHGTGQMRDAVQNVLRQTKSVKNFRFGGEGEGGVGATIVEFY